MRYPGFQEESELVKGNGFLWIPKMAALVFHPLATPEQSRASRCQGFALDPFAYMSALAGLSIRLPHL